MFQNMLMTSVTPLCNTNEIQQWENRPFMNDWPEVKRHKSSKDSHITKTIKKRNKRHRTSYTTEQLKILEKTFCRTKYINTEHRKELAESLRIGEKCIKVWFQNRRMKEKRESSESSCDSSSECYTESITPPPENTTATNQEQYIAPCHYEAIPNNIQRDTYYPYVENTEVISPLSYFNQNYDASNINYNIPTQTNEYFRYDNNIYPTQYYPCTVPSYTYTNLDENQSLQRVEEHAWSANMFDFLI